jgi:hypothetical protein
MTSTIVTRLFEIVPSFVTGVYLVVWALLYALLEISTEGGVGWALGAPTWRKKSWFYGAVKSGKELTGYHLFMFFLPYLFLHLPLIFAFHWGLDMFTWWRECELLAVFFVLCPAWDLWWFILNPDFTLQRFRPGEIWWHAKWIGRIPVDYVSAAVSVVLFTVLGSFGEPEVARRMCMVVLCFIIATVLLMKYAPLYHRWYAAMKKKHRLVQEDWARWLYPNEVKGVLQHLANLEEIRHHLAWWGRERARREQIAPCCAGILVRGDRKVAPTTLFNWWGMVHRGGWRKTAVFRIANLADADKGYRVGYRPSNPEQWIIGKERVLPELRTNEFFRMRIGHEDCAFYAVDRERKELELVPVIITDTDNPSYRTIPLY